MVSFTHYIAHCLCLGDPPALAFATWKFNIVGNLRDSKGASLALDRQGLNFVSSVRRAVSSHSTQHPQEIPLAQFSLYVHTGGLKPYSFYFIA